MSTDSASSFHSAPEPSTPTPTEGPLPLPEESPFLSDHGIVAVAPPTGPRPPAEPPSGLSQFPPPSAPVIAAATGSQASPRPISNHATFQAPPPGRATHESSSSFPMYLAGGGEDPVAPGGRGSGALLVGSGASGGGNELLDRLKTILVTTTDSLQGRLVEQYLGLVTAEALVPTDSLLEGAERTGRFARYKTSQQKLKALQQLVVAELKLEADKLGGNAVVGSHLATTIENGVILVVATGTAVRVV